MNLVYSNERGSDSRSMTKKWTRDLTKMGDLILARNQGKKILWSSMRRINQLKNSKKKLISFLGSVARHYVPIDIIVWHEVSEELMNKIREDISVSKFRII